MSQLLLTNVSPDAHRSGSIFRHRHVSYRHIGAVAATSDFVLILMASIVAGVVYHLLVFETEGDVEAFFAIGIFTGSIFVLLSKLLGLYRPKSLVSAGVQFRGAFLSWAAALLFVTSVLFFLKSGANYSRGATVGFGVFGFGLMLLSRAITGVNLRRAIADGSLAGPRVIVIGDPEELATKPALDLLRTYGTREVARFNLPPATRESASNVGDDLAVVDSVIAAAQAQRAEQVLLALRWVDSSRRDLICERLRILPLSVLLLPDQFVSSILPKANGELCSATAIEVQRAPLSQQDLIVKRLFDLLFASLCLLIFSPLLLTTSIAIKLDSAGPVIFRQRRRGFNGADFGIYKFRTMTVLEDGPTIRQVRPNDERVTWLGRLLRASSIDELPQLLNVLSGEMSLVGPRPHAVAHDEEYSHSIDNYAFRHHVRPGITGWAQIHGFRGATVEPSLMERRVRFDLWYVNNWSFWLDLRIIARTCIELLRPRNAY
jgi:undecaprenyl-phosphate galactose phosphotransferase/putative colanic acid biosynthesis UDP-glucose lipid carrier transferase